VTASFIRWIHLTVVSSTLHCCRNCTTLFPWQRSLPVGIIYDTTINVFTHTDSLWRIICMSIVYTYRRYSRFSVRRSIISYTVHQKLRHIMTDAMIITHGNVESCVSQQNVQCKQSKSNLPPLEQRRMLLFIADNNLLLLSKQCEHAHIYTYTVCIALYVRPLRSIYIYIYYIKEFSIYIHIYI
jgi:hypothetical protein